VRESAPHDVPSIGSTIVPFLRRHPVGFEDLPLRRSAQGQQPSHRYLYVPVFHV
jgi:hypothetical protein